MGYKNSILVFTFTFCLEYGNGQDSVIGGNPSNLCELRLATYCLHVFCLTCIKISIRECGGHNRALP